VQELVLEEAAVLVREGQVGRAIFVVEEGSLTVTVDGVEVSTLQKGACVGEVSLTISERATATVKAASKVG